MKFTDILHTAGTIPVTGSATDEHSALSTKKHRVLDEAVEHSPEDLLRAAGFKIKLVTSTSFGTQIDLAKHYGPAEITDVLSEFNIKIKGQSIFIVE